MWRKILLFTSAWLLVIPFTLQIFSSPINTVYAEGESKSDLSGFNCSKGGFFSDEFNETVEEYKEEDANMAEKFLTGQLQNLWNIGDINGLSTLIFGNPYCVWADDYKTDETTIMMAPDGIFTLAEREKIIDPLLKMFSAIFVTLLVLAMMFSGLKLGFSAVKGRAMSEFGDDLKMWFFAVIFIGGYGIITNAIFQLNAAVVLSFKDLLETNGVKVDSFSIMAAWDPSLDLISIASMLLAVLGEWILALILNFIYIARKVIVLVLLVLGFVAGYSLLFTKTRPFFGTWLRELLGNVFLQSIHALILYGMAMFAATGAGVFYKLGLMMMFIPLTGMISKWLQIGDSSSKLGSTMTMVGLGGVMSTMMLTSQAGNIIRGGNIGGSTMIGGANTNSSYDGSSDNATSFGTSLMGSGGGSDSSLTSISTDASGATSNTWMNSKAAVSKMGGAVLGAAGVVAGPMGIMAGKAIGEKATGALMQAPRNIGMGMKNTINTIQSARNYTGAQGTGFRSMMNDLPARREFFGNLGESVGSIAGAGGLGRSLGNGLSGVSRQRLAATSITSGGRGMVDSLTGNVVPTTYDSLARQYPGASMQMVQTNKGSSMWLNDNGKFHQVGLTGAADPTLKQGEARLVDYQLPGAGQQFSLQQNGSYKDMSNIGTTSDSFANMSSSSISSKTLDNTSSSISFTGSQSGPSPSREPLAVSGLAGSTPSLMRTSNSYVVGGATQNGEINATTIARATSSNAVKYADQNFKAERINPDSYVYHNPVGVKNASTSDKIADSVHKTTSNIDKSWQAVAKRTKNQERTKRVV
ncbi:MAG: hypothetical protein ABS939_00080 [Psychrobacillus sp.]